MLIVSSREFRKKQKIYLDKADAGIEILVHRGKNKSYKIVPVLEDNAVIESEYILKPNDDLAKAITADELLARLIPRIEKLFDKE